MKNKIIP